MIITGIKPASTKTFSLLDLDKEDPLSLDTPRETMQKLFEENIPRCLILAAESQSKKNPWTEFYEACNFCVYLRMKEKSIQEAGAQLGTRKKITSVQYIFLETLKLDQRKNPPFKDFSYQANTLTKEALCPLKIHSGYLDMQACLYTALASNSSPTERLKASFALHLHFKNLYESGLCKDDTTLEEAKTWLWSAKEQKKHLKPGVKTRI